MRKILLAGIGSWLAMMAVSLTVAITLENHNVDNLLLAMARSHLSQIVTTRVWNAEHHGVYVFASEKNPPNKYLAKDPERDLTLADGRLLTKINPAYMTRQLSELAERSEGYRLHMTSLNPISPANGASEWEKTALKAFEGGASEIYEYMSEGEDRYFRYMTPLNFQPECVKCHELASGQSDKIRGGIALTLLNPPDIDHTWTIIGHIVIALAGVGTVILLGRKLVAIYAKTERDALIDPLTGLYNRRHLIDRLTQDLRASHRTGEPLGLLMVDIDHFKKYNDTFGHIEGDKALKAVANTLGLSLKRPQDLAARFGGEEFIGVLPQTSAKGLKKVAERLRCDVQALATPHPENAGPGVVTVSIGAYLYSQKPQEPFAEDTVNKVINLADEALYKAKLGGRNKVEIYGEGAAGGGAGEAEEGGNVCPR